MVKIFRRVKDNKAHKKMTKEILIEGRIDCSLVEYDTKNVSWRDI